MLVGASKATQLDDNLGASNGKLTRADIVEVAAGPVYPNWYVAGLADQPVTTALGSDGPARRIAVTAA